MVRALAPLVLLALAAGCRGDPPAPAAPGAIGAEDQRSACTRRGGRYEGTAAGAFYCLREHADAGRQCRTGADCAGECLARSGTCAPVSPLFGCHDVLDARGRQVTQCLR